jgi:hypothetical protein
MSPCCCFPFLFPKILVSAVSSPVCDVIHDLVADFRRVVEGARGAWIGIGFTSRHSSSRLEDRTDFLHFLFVFARAMKIRTLFQAALVLPLGVESAQATASALSALKSLDYRYFVAGGTCAAISHGITTPIDVVC